MKYYLDRKPTFSLFSSLRILIIILLLFSSVLKFFTLIETKDASFSTFNYPVWFHYIIAGAEFILALWLIFGICISIARLFAIACFLIFSVASLHSALFGNPVCKCFGYLAVSPWLTSIVDLSILTALFFIKPTKNNIQNQELFNDTRAAFSGLAISLVCLVAISELALFCYGSIAHENRLLFSRTDNNQNRVLTNNHAVQAPTMDGELQNITPFLTEIGIKPSFTFERNESIDQFFVRVSNEIKNKSVSIESIHPEEAFRGLSVKDHFLPIVFKDKYGKVFTLLGVFKNQGNSFYEILVNKQAPVLVQKSAGMPPKVGPVF